MCDTKIGYWKAVGVALLACLALTTTFFVLFTSLCVGLVALSRTTITMYDLTRASVVYGYVSIVLLVVGLVFTADALTEKTTRRADVNFLKDIAWCGNIIALAWRLISLISRMFVGRLRFAV